MDATSAYHTALQISKSPFYFKKNFTAKRSFSFRYILYRFVRPLLKVHYRIFKWLHPNTPWTSQAAIKIFENILDKGMTGFEYGSGNSTIFFARSLRHLTSVEHHEEWFGTVKAKLQGLGLTNVDYHFVPPLQNDRTVTYSFCSDFHLKEHDFTVNSEYDDYFSLIKKYPDAHFDFIMVDGRARVECSLNAISKLKSGGIFVLDNSDRDRYETVFRVLKDWKMVTTTTGLFDTTIWFKP